MSNLHPAVVEPAGSPMPVVEPVEPAQQVQPERMSHAVVRWIGVRINQHMKGKK